MEGCEKMKILVVEDDMVLAEEICRLLEKWGFQGECLEDFSAVDKEWEKRRAQLILMDINLPYYDHFCKVPCKRWAAGGKEAIIEGD